MKGVVVAIVAGCSRSRTLTQWTSRWERCSPLRCVCRAAWGCCVARSELERPSEHLDAVGADVGALSVFTDVGITADTWIGWSSGWDRPAILLTVRSSIGRTTRRSREVLLRSAATLRMTLAPVRLRRVLLVVEAFLDPDGEPRGHRQNVVDDSTAPVDAFDDHFRWCVFSCPD